MENCFDRQVSFISKGYDGANDKYTREKVKKTATFKELDATEKTQHRLHFLITSVFKSSEIDQTDPGKKATVKIDTDVLYDLVVKSINVLWVETPAFSSLEKEEFLTDSGALLDFGMWFLEEKLTPFFLTLMAG